MQASETPADVADRLIDAMVGMARAAKRSQRFAVDQGSYFMLHLLELRGELRLTELAAAAELDTSTVSRHLRQLEDSDLVSSKPDPGDRRAKHFTLTAGGEALLERARTERRALLSERLSTWSTDDVTTLERLMTRLADEVLQSNPAKCPEPEDPETEDPETEDKDPLTPNDNDNPQHRKETRG
ncbi:MarR family winged helix-turn-helix transcriptional regulator [Enemella evansiae]|uniref:MarR family winged helix-turn-helix transcriptional regulator n=1 Tax=Enemella evansiae TaxID=2016499 RepID=UPI000B97C28C|nr:MarR family transcriptional regulator [Enemella evansiae]OYO08091.1 hypothetical protein CGZ98_16170 [Enemella evansiae]OYO10402.1 hypothetical protein BI335_17905 [Enemella evansiae]